MDEAQNNISKIALNLTCSEFNGYCKGMALRWFFKCESDKKKNYNAFNRSVFWEGAYDKHKHNCKDSPT